MQVVLALGQVCSPAGGVVVVEVPVVPVCAFHMAVCVDVLYGQIWPVMLNDGK